MKKISLGLLSLLLLTSCGGSSSGGSNKSTEGNRNPIQVDLDIDAGIEGQYLAVFETLNPQLTSKITGAFTFSRDKFEDELVGDVRLTNGGAEVIHAQNVRIGTRCPGPEDDLNGDGLIDATEGEAVYGKILFPLDGDIGTQSSHDGEYPVGDTYGNYIYSRVTKFTKFIQDLRNHEQGDGYVKLKRDEPLEIEGKVVTIHGVDPASDLPASVSSVGRMTKYQSLPIVCGVIKKVLSFPGRIDDGVYENHVIE